MTARDSETEAQASVDPATDSEPTAASNGSPDSATADPSGGKPMTIWEHLDELRKRLIWSAAAFIAGCLGAWGLRERILALLVRPFAQAWKAQNLPGGATLHFAAPAAPLMAYVKLSMLGGLVFAAPIIFYQLWAFIAPGLYAREKKVVIPFVLLATVLFVGGGYFGWLAAFPFTFDYFLSLAGNVGNEIDIKPTVMMGEYIDFVSQMLLAFGLVFEIPLIILFLSMLGIVNYLTLLRFGRWYVLIAFIVAAIFTPPDMTQQLLIAIPMIVLYFLSIGLAFLFGKPPSEEQKAAFRNRKKRVQPKSD